MHYFSPHSCSGNYMGQNIYQAWYNLYYHVVTQAFHDEIEDWNFLNPTKNGAGYCNQGKVCGHYTQVQNSIPITKQEMSYLLIEHNRCIQLNYLNIYLLMKTLRNAQTAGSKPGFKE